MRSLRAAEPAACCAEPSKAGARAPAALRAWLESSGIKLAAASRRSPPAAHSLFPHLPPALAALGGLASMQAYCNSNGDCIKAGGDFKPPECSIFPGVKKEASRPALLAPRPPGPARQRPCSMRSCAVSPCAPQPMLLVAFVLYLHLPPQGSGSFSPALPSSGPAAGGGHPATDFVRSSCASVPDLCSTRLLPLPSRHVQYQTSAILLYETEPCAKFFRFEWCVRWGRCGRCLPPASPAPSRPALPHGCCAPLPLLLPRTPPGARLHCCPRAVCARVVRITPQVAPATRGPDRLRRHLLPTARPPACPSPAAHRLPQVGLGPAGVLHFHHNCGPRDPQRAQLQGGWVGGWVAGWVGGGAASRGCARRLLAYGHAGLQLPLSPSQPQRHFPSPGCLWPRPPNMRQLLAGPFPCQPLYGALSVGLLLRAQRPPMPMLRTPCAVCAVGAGCSPHHSGHVPGPCVPLALDAVVCCGCMQRARFCRASAGCPAWPLSFEARGMWSSGGGAPNSVCGAIVEEGPWGGWQ